MLPPSVTPAADTPVHPQWLGLLPYRWAHLLQRLRRESVIEGIAPEAFWLLEHPPVVTTGRRSVDDLPDAGRLVRAGIDLVRTERGGLATYHGPGQLVGYLILDAEGRGLKVRAFVERVEEGILRWLAQRGVPGGRRAGYPGVWLGREKICAVGMHFHRGVSLHGFALNLTNDLGGFSLITPCGITDGGVTSLERAQGTAPTPEEAASSVAASVLGALGVRCR